MVSATFFFWVVFCPGGRKRLIDLSLGTLQFFFLDETPRFFVGVIVVFVVMMAPGFALALFQGLVWEKSPLFFLHGLSCSRKMKVSG